MFLLLLLLLLFLKIRGEIGILRMSMLPDLASFISISGYNMIKLKALISFAFIKCILIWQKLGVQYFLEKYTSASEL